MVVEAATQEKRRERDLRESKSQLAIWGRSGPKWNNENKIKMEKKLNCFL